LSRGRVFSQSEVLTEQHGEFRILVVNLAKTLDHTEFKLLDASLISRVNGDGH